MPDANTMRRLTISKHVHYTRIKGRLPVFLIWNINQQTKKPWQNTLIRNYSSNFTIQTGMLRLKNYSFANGSKILRGVIVHTKAGAKVMHIILPFCSDLWFGNLWRNFKTTFNNDDWMRGFFVQQIKLIQVACHEFKSDSKREAWSDSCSHAAKERELFFAYPRWIVRTCLMIPGAVDKVFPQPGHVHW